VSPDVRRIDPDSLAPTDERAIPLGQVDLTVDLGGIAMANPITTASGCFASGPEIDRFYDVTDLGAIVVKSITPEPREGLPTPRMCETPSGMLNAIGLQNPGIDAWLERDLPWLQARGAKVIASIAGKTVDDFREVARKLKRHRPGMVGAPGAGGVVGLEVNLSCPNVEHRGLVFACSPIDSAEVISAVKREADVPVFAKLTSDVTDVVEIARAVLDAGADGLTLINTLLGMAIDPETGKPELSNTYGGLSGPAIRPIAVRNVHQIHQAFPDVPIIGCGGVREVTDVIEFVRAGASAIAVGTATFIDPFAAKLLVDEMRAWLAQRGIPSVAELRGQVHPW
jgi:dihydroorotate dehydrogenase (NAD+) catalytic subunit